MRPRTEQKPNVIIILCDDLGYGDLGCYGSDRNRTPRLDRMAAEGMRFTDFYVAAPLCSPSRAALLTGCYPRRVGLAEGHGHPVLFPGDPIGLHPDEVTIAGLLKAEGYGTKIIGKWHLGDQPPFLPRRFGFDSYFGLPYSNDMLPEHPANDRYGFPLLPLMRDDDVVAIDPNQASLTDHYTREAVGFIEQHRDRPFFLYFAHMYVHEPIYAPYNFLARSRNGPYGAAVEQLDHSVGTLLDTLAELGIDDRTLVIFTSDNGSNGRDGGSNAPLRGTKGTTWEGGMREPCIARWPGAIAAGGTCREIVTAMDFLPTIARLTGAVLEAGRPIDGGDIVPLLFGALEATSPYDAFGFYRGSELGAVRSGRWKLHLDDPLLFDLQADVGETHDLSDQHPAVVRRLQGLAEAFREDLGDARVGMVGRNCRPAGRVEHPETLTRVAREHPYMKAGYD